MLDFFHILLSLFSRLDGAFEVMEEAKLLFPLFLGSFLLQMPERIVLSSSDSLPPGDLWHPRSDISYLSISACSFDIPTYYNASILLLVKKRGMDADSVIHHWIWVGNPGRKDASEV